MILVLFLHEKRPETVVTAEKLQPASRLKSVGNSLSILLGTFSFWVILFYFATPSFPGWGIKNWLPTLFSESLNIEMSVAGPMSTILIAFASFLGVITGGILADRWVGKNVRGRIYAGAIGLTLTIPALFLLGFGNGIVSIAGGGVLFGLGFGMFDANNMPILCQFVSPRHRAAGYGLLNMSGVFAGALVTSWLGKSADAGSLGPDLALLAIPVSVAIALQLYVLRPAVTDKTDD